MPWNQLPGPVRAVAKVAPILKPVVPYPGIPLQLVHHDDVAEAIAVAATAPAPPGAYNIAGDGVVTVSEVAKAAGWPAGAGSLSGCLGGVGGNFADAVYPLDAGMAARRAGVGGNGHHQGAHATRLVPGPLIGGDAGGTRRGSVTCANQGRLAAWVM